jgi:dTDP-4-dehydrorhamnose reductase
MGEKMIKKVLIIGSKGMAGHMIKEYLIQKEYDVYGTFREKEEKNLEMNEFYLDAFDKGKLEEILKKVKPDFVINCIGILNQFAENNPDIAIYVNGYFPHYLDRLSEKYGYKLIHITTDCVFSGKKGNYTEDDFRDADSYYGRSKAIGEVNNNKTLTFRTSIIGPDINKDGIGLFNWFMKQEGKIKGYSNVFWSGVTTLELAKAIEASFNQNISGIVHLVNNKKISKYDLLKLFSKYMNKDIEIEKYEDYFSDKSLIRTKEEFNYKVPNYEKMIEELSEWIKNKNDRYGYR